MSLNWGTVLGGVGRPRYLLCGTELIENSSFEANTYGWVGYPAITDITRVLDTDTFWGDYSCKISDIGAQAERSKGRYTVDIDGELANRKFALSFYVKGAAAASCSAVITALDEELAAQTKAVSTAYTHYMGIFEFATSERESFNIDIFAVAGGSYANDVYVDKVSCREISNDYYAEFPYLPNLIKPTYQEDLMSSKRLVDGSLKEYNKGWEPRFEIRYDYLDQTAEYYRRLISESNFIWLQPHYDYEYWVAVKWDREWEQSYFGGVAAGNVGNMLFKSIFLLESKPLSPA